MDDVKGCGIQLENRLRDCFFEIMGELAKLLTWCVSQDLTNQVNLNMIRFIISAFQWNFLARDFKSLHNKLTIFNLFYSGQITQESDEEAF